MKSKEHSFSYLMELIIVIFFFAISTTFCVTFIVQAKQRQAQATSLSQTLLKAESMIATMQAHPKIAPDQLFDVQKIDDSTYQGDHFSLIIYQDEVKHGVIKIYEDDKCLNELPFVIGGNHDA